ncbi:MAG: ATP-dependent zinc metalloprotease FtsH [Phycisphaerae bacterium]|nr:ATP-dependent zinc metalloprotease FtsH [Phycisphaerae bacterium]
MATVRKLAGLFRAIAAEDLASASAIATEICKAEQRQGHTTAARLLRGALHPNGRALTQAEGPPGPFPGSTGFLSTGLVRLAPDVQLQDVVLTTKARQELQAVILEWRHRERLQQRGIQPRSKLLFHGPPGCGKSLSARAIGRELGIPTFVVRFDAIIGAYLGQTAIHLRQLFHFTETTPCVLLLDELDALGKKRGSPLDVGELDRIVIALMQELEHSRPAGLIIGTSNLAKHLDDALWRRFDLTLLFKAPSRKVLTSYAKRLARAKGIRLPVSVLRRTAAADSFAHAEGIVIGEARRQALRTVG